MKTRKRKRLMYLQQSIDVGGVECGLLFTQHKSMFSQEQAKHESSYLQLWGKSLT